ncbi:MAG: polysaccharide biosynthesis tyrosine autokinase [Bacteroidota bacterium]
MMIGTENKSQNLGTNQYLPNGIQLVGQKDNMLNELAILSSRKLISRTLESLDFEVAYFEKTTFKYVERYQDPIYPFEVEVDWTHPQFAVGYIEIEPISETQATLRVKEKEYFIYNKEDDTYQEIKGGDAYEVEETITFGQPFENELMSFTINPREGASFQESKGYGFKIIPNALYTAGYQQLVEINRIPDANYITLNIEGATPNKEIRYIDSLCSTYIRMRLEQKNSFAQGTINFISAQLSAVTDSLDEARTALADKSKNTSDISGSVGEMTMDIQRKEEKVGQLNVQVNYIEQRLKEINGQQSLDMIIAAAPTTAGIQDPNLIALMRELRELNEEKREKELTSAANSIEVQNLKVRINGKLSQLKASLENVKSTLKYQIQTVRRQIGQAKGRVSNATGESLEIKKYSSQFFVNEDLANYLRQRLAEASISKAATRPDSYILDQARLSSTEPVSPKKGIIIASAIVFSLLLPLVLILGLDFFDTKLRSADQLKSMTDIPMLATLLHEKKSDAMFEQDFILSPLAESFRYLKVNVDYLLDEAMGQRVIAVTSMVKGEGKTFTSSHLAAVMALSGKKTVIIGADIRRPQLYKRLRQENEVGLSNFLAGKAGLNEIVKETAIHNLDIITSGHRPPNPLEILNSARFEDLVEALKVQYDYVIIDTPPVGLVSDFLVLNQHADVELVVIRQNYSRKDFVKEANELKASEKLNRVYYVLNDVKISKSGYGRYGSRYGYGYGDDEKKPKKKKTKKAAK